MSPTYSSGISKEIPVLIVTLWLGAMDLVVIEYKSHPASSLFDLVGIIARSSVFFTFIVFPANLA